MPKVDDVAWMSQRHGFLVRQDDDQPIASFEFTSEAEAQAAQKKCKRSWRPALRRWATPESRERAVDKGWLARHESGTHLKFTPAGAELFA